MGGLYYKNGRWKDPKKILKGKRHNIRQVGKPGIRWEDVVLRDTTHILEYEDRGDEQKTERNGGVFWDRAGPRRGSSATDGMEWIVTVIELCT